MNVRAQTKHIQCAHKLFHGLMKAHIVSQNTCPSSTLFRY